MKNFLLGFVKFSSTHLSSGVFFGTNALQKDLNEKRSCKVQLLSAILNLVWWPGSFPGLLNHKCYRRREWIAFDRAAVKQQKKTKKNAIKLDESSNSRTLNSLHQVNIMLLELDLRMLLYFCRKLSVSSEEEHKTLFFSWNKLQNGVRVRPRPHESGYFWNRIYFYANRPSIHTKPVNSLTETASFWNCFFESADFADSCGRPKPDIFESTDDLRNADFGTY